MVVTTDKVVTRRIHIMFAIVEKDNPLALHGLFDNCERAEMHLRETIPVYVARSYFMDKTLTADSFVIVERR